MRKTGMLLSLLLCLSAVSCAAAENDAVAVTETDSEIITTEAEPTTASALTTSAAETASAIAVTAAETTSASEDETILRIVKEACISYYNSPGYTEENAAEDAAYMIERAKAFTEQAPVELNSEEAAISRARTVFIKAIGQDFVNELESDFYEKNGEMLKLERDAPPYRCVYFDVYDVWIVTAVLRSGKLEDGTGLEHTGESPYVILNGKDGALLAAHC